MSEFLIKDRQGYGMNYDRHNEWYAHFEGEGSGRRIVGQLKNMTYVRMMAANWNGGETYWKKESERLEQLIDEGYLKPLN